MITLAGPHTPLDAERWIHAQAFVALIAQELARDDDIYIPARLMEILLKTGVARLSGSMAPRFTLLGIPAPATGPARAILRDWLAAARDRLSLGASA
jgi:hypothetical protein